MKRTKDMYQNDLVHKRKRTLFGNTLIFFGETYKYIENLNVPYRALVHH